MKLRFEAQDPTEMCGDKAHPAATYQQLNLLWSEQVLERRLVGDHMEASPESFELLLHTLVQHVLGILSHKLLHRDTPASLSTAPAIPRDIVADICHSSCSH